jgi:hypothetical protein
MRSRGVSQCCRLAYTVGLRDYGKVASDAIIKDDGDNHQHCSALSKLSIVSILSAQVCSAVGQAAAFVFSRVLCP